MHIIAILAWAASAGFPVSKDMTCPVGGEEFTITTTSSCSSGHGPTTMSLFTPSSCDFVTRLPQCPSNGLPLYRDFSPAEVALLDEFVGSEDYRGARVHSRWLLADVVAEYLEEMTGQRDPERLYLLLGGFRYESLGTFGDKTYTRRFEALVQERITDVAEAERPYLQALLAFALVKIGDQDAARATVDSIVVLDTADDFVTSYVEAVEACVADPASGHCAPSSRVPGT